jgi:hypothetical protein
LDRQLCCCLERGWGSSCIWRLVFNDEEEGRGVGGVLNLFVWMGWQLELTCDWQ